MKRGSVEVQARGREKESARFVPREVPGTEKVRPAQLVLLAMGFVGPEQTLLEKLGVERDPRTNVRAEHGKFATTVRGVFAAGDCRLSARTPSSRLRPDTQIGRTSLRG